MQTSDNSITVRPRRGLLGRHLTSKQGHGAQPDLHPQGRRSARARRGSQAHDRRASCRRSSIGEVLDIPMTAHFLGGAVISDSPSTGVIDPYHRV